MMDGKMEEYAGLPGSYNFVTKALKTLGLFHILFAILLLVCSAVGTYECESHHCKEWGGSIYVHGSLDLLYVLLGSFDIFFAKRRTLSGFIVIFIFDTFSFTASMVTLATSYINIHTNSYNSVWMVFYIFTGVLIFLEFILSVLTIFLVVKLLVCPSPHPVKQDGPA